MEDNITDAQIEAAWGNANFGEGNNNKRGVINDALLKIACGYGTGFTSICICRELGLMKKSGDTLTKLGKRYLYRTFSPVLREKGVCYG